MKNDDVKLERSYEKNIKIMGKSLRTSRIMLICTLGIVYTVMLFMENNSWIALAFTGFFTALLAFTFYAKQIGIVYFGEYSLEVSASGDIFITILHGHCPKCEGHLKLHKKRKTFNTFIVFIKCDLNDSHIWNADAFEKEQGSMKE